MSTWVALACGCKSQQNWSYLAIISLNRWPQSDHLGISDLGMEVDDFDLFPPLDLFVRIMGNYAVISPALRSMWSTPNLQPV